MKKNLLAGLILVVISVSVSYWLVSKRITAVAGPQSIPDTVVDPVRPGVLKETVVQERPLFYDYECHESGKKKKKPNRKHQFDERKYCLMEKSSSL